MNKRQREQLIKDVARQMCEDNEPGRWAARGEAAMPLSEKRGYLTDAETAVTVIESRFDLKRKKVDA